MMPDAVKMRIVAIIKWAVGGGLLVGLIMAVTQCSIARNEARMATIQTYNMSRIAEFRDSGAALDKATAAFNDAASEKRDLTDVRKDFRNALAEHAAETMAMGDAFGNDSLVSYQANLKQLQVAVESTEGVTTPGPIITALSRVVVERNRLAKVVTKNATG